MGVKLTSPLWLTALLVWAHAPLRYAGFVYEDEWWYRASQAVPAWSSPRLIPFMLWRWQLRHAHGPLAFHLANALLALIVGALVALLTWRLSGSKVAAWSASAIWLLHPLSVETIVYVAARPELCAMIGILTACCAVTWRGWAAWLGAGAGIAVALTSKESAVVVIGLVPLAWAMARQRHVAASTAVGLAVVAGAILASPLARVLWPSSWAWPLLQVTAWHRLLTWVIWPMHLTLDADYDLVPVAARVVSAASLLALIVVTWLARRQAPALLFGLGWMLIALLPRFIVQTNRSYLNPHQFALAFVGLLMGAMITMSSWCEGKARGHVYH